MLTRVLRSTWYARRVKRPWPWEYRAWRAMRLRCGVPGGRGSPKYVARGMADEWKSWPEGYASFLRYVADHLGPHPGLGWSIDRIDSNRGYFPGNIRWAPIKDQRIEGGRLGGVARVAQLTHAELISSVKHARAHLTDEQLSAIGRSGGSARARRLSPEQRSAAARHAANAQWAQRRGT